MQTFDVYLKKRLTEIDVIITQLVQRDTFSIYDWLYLFATLDDIELRKSLEVDTSMILDVTMADILKIVAEQIYSKLYLDVDMSLLNQIITDGKAGMVLFPSTLDATEILFTGGNSSLDISVDVLDYYIAHSFGNAEFDMKLLVDELDTLKYDFEKIINELELSVDIDFSSIKNTNFDKCKLILDIDQTDIFYLLTMAGRAVTYIGVAPIEEYILKKVLYGATPVMYLDVGTNINWQSQKFLEIDSSMNLLADITEVLIPSISGQANMCLDCEASAGLKRYRLLHEMDDLTLNDFDNMTLEEVDYVILAE